MREAIELAWYGPASAAAIAAEHVTSESTVKKIWREAKARGDLPKDAARPAFDGKTGAPKATDESALDFDKMTDEQFAEYQRIEDERFEIAQRANAISCEALLGALVREHGMPRRMSNGAILPPAGMAPDISEEIVAHLAREKAAEVLA